VHNELLRAELSSLTDGDYIADNVQRWCVTILVGAAIGVIGFISQFAIERISAVKFNLVAYYLSRDWRLAYAIYAWSNVLLVLVGSVLIVYFCPAAAGSGLPEVKAYLNGAAVSGQRQHRRTAATRSSRSADADITACLLFSLCSCSQFAT
jgi:chloride channel 7